jgi:hypothetical protein
LQRSQPRPQTSELAIPRPEKARHSLSFSADC